MTSTRSGHLNRVTSCWSNQTRQSSSANGPVDHDERAHPLAEAQVGLADDDGLAHVGMGLEQALDLHRSRCSRRPG